MLINIIFLLSTLYKISIKNLLFFDRYSVANEIFIQNANISLIKMLEISVFS